LEASVLGNLGAPAWTINPSNGSAGTIDANGVYTPPTAFPPGVTLATATATAGGVSASSLLCLVDAVFAFSVMPPSVVLGPSGQQPFTVEGPDMQWSLLTPNVGMISQSGVYTAPAAIPAPATAIVMVQMSGDANLIGLGVVMLTPAS
jgi:hypothetical protein